MKPILYTLILLFVQSAYAQTVPSNCTAPDSILSKYTDDADYATLSYLEDINSPYADSAIILQGLSDTIRRAMIAVYNATALPARDSVVTMYHIHDYRVQELKKIELIADKNTGFISQIKNGIIPTGILPFDNLLNKYHLNIISHGNTPGMSGAYSLYCTSDSNYNMEAVGGEFMTLPGMWYAKKTALGGDGNYIWADTVTDSYTILIYSFGWMDCPSGCIWRHNWHFSIDKDCTVTYAGSSGDPVPPAGVDDVSKNRVVIYPNPVTEMLHIEGVHAITYSIYNIWGQVVNSGVTNGDISVTQLPAGAYFISLKNKDAISVGKFVKE